MGKALVCCLLKIDDLPGGLRCWGWWLNGLWLNNRTPSWDWPVTHTTHTHTESIECPSRREDTASGPGASAGIQRAVKVSPQFPIQPTVNYWHGKTQPSASTPSAAFKPNSSTSLCAWDSLDPNPSPQLLNKRKKKAAAPETEGHRENGHQRWETIVPRAKWMTHWDPLGLPSMSSPSEQC